MNKKIIASIIVGLIVIASIGFNVFTMGSKVINDNNSKYYQAGFVKAKIDLYNAIKEQGSVLVVIDETNSILVTEKNGN